MYAYVYVCMRMYMYVCVCICMYASPTRDHSRQSILRVSASMKPKSSLKAYVYMNIYMRGLPLMNHDRVLQKSVILKSKSSLKAYLYVYMYESPTSDES